MCYKDADIFYKVRDLWRFVFIDTSKPDGAKTFYDDNIPEEEQDPADPFRAKINVVFSRADFHFKYNPNYQLPKNVNDILAFSCYKYEFESSKTTDKEIGKYYANKSVKGSMNYGVNNGKIVPDEFYNVLKQHEKIKTFINPLKSGYNITEDFPDMKLSH